MRNSYVTDFWIKRMTTKIVSGSSLLSQRCFDLSCDIKQDTFFRITGRRIGMLKAPLQGMWAQMTILGILLGMLTNAHAHFLNMTKGTLTVQPDAQSVSLELDIDLTRILKGSEHYYDLTRQGAVEQQAVMDGITRRILAGLNVRLGSETLVSGSYRWELPQLPLEEFTRPLAAPMAKVWSDYALPETAGDLQFATDPTLPLEYPFVLTMQMEDSPQRMSRWLVAGQSSPKFAVAPVLASPPIAAVSSTAPARPSFLEPVRKL